MSNIIRQVELIMVTENNNNKVYKMLDDGSGQLKVEYGRIGQNLTSETYPINMWDKKYREKIKKGYKDLTELKAVKKTGGVLLPDNLEIQNFYSTFRNYTTNSVNKNYIIETSAVTKMMLDAAQNSINELVTSTDKADVTLFNKYLLELYTVLPRKISNVRDALVKEFNKDNWNKIVEQEQNVLDSLQSSANISVLSEEDVPLSSILNCDIQEVNLDEYKLISDIINPTNKTRHKIYKVFKINTPTKTRFDNWLSQQQNKRVDLLIHGTRSENVFNILKTGLLIKPSNAVISGSIYGVGVYHSSHATKSLGYTGYHNDKILFLQSVHMGNTCEYKGWYRKGKGLRSSDMNYHSLKKMGYDSLYVSAGDGLLNSEYIVYNIEQTTTEYLVWLK